jgi:uncharacterized protein (DUF305 family)
MRFVDARLVRVAMLPILIGAAACRTTAVDGRAPIVQPGAPGEPARVITAATAADLSKVQFTPADVRFMQGMIGHHAQAIDMTALVASRTARENMRLLARRIELSQEDEIKMMQGWLRTRGQEVPAAHVHELMPGMLTPEEMDRLAQANGPEFDRLFLEGMIKHHDGALVMVKDLFNSPGAGQDSEIFAFASDVDTDQRMEIERMGAMLVELQK